MLKTIKTHNYLNGLRFSFLEYFLAAAVIAPFAAYYLSHARWLYGLIALGIICNCLVISIIALGAILRKEPSIGLMRIRRDADLRRKVMQQHPHLSRQTITLSIGVLIPFFIAAALLLEPLLPRRMLKA